MHKPGCVGKELQRTPSEASPPDVLLSRTLDTIGWRVTFYFCTGYIVKALSK